MIFIKTFLRQDQGVTAIEYGLIALLIALSVITGAQVIGINLKTIFNTLSPYLAI
jgi:pilus assembly protein Flp/PilA